MTTIPPSDGPADGAAPRQPRTGHTVRAMEALMRAAWDFAEPAISRDGDTGAAPTRPSPGRDDDGIAP